jgi:PucR C-terminal helix-turn-helix domain
VSKLPKEPWRQLPPTVATLIRPELPPLRDEILEVIAAEVPDYARPLEGSFGRGIRLGVEEALRIFADLIEDPDSPAATSREVYVQLGAGEMRQGRSLDALQAAYRIGARLMWRRLSATGRRAGLSTDVLCDVADAIFAYIDELAASSVEGYAQAQEAAAGERERRRRRLLATILSESYEPGAVESAAHDANWDVPREVAVLICRADDLDRIARRLTQDALAGTIEELGCIVIPDPAGPGRPEMIEQATENRAAALGPTRPLAEVRASFTRARTGFAAGGSAGGLYVVDKHLAEIALFEAREPVGDLATQRLAPLEELTPGAQERMRQTLRAYLDQRGNAAAMAGQLHLHPQTVRYRLRQLRELFGPALDEPQARFELELALRV